MKEYSTPKISTNMKRNAVPVAAGVGLAEAAVAAASAAGFFAGTRLIRALRGGSPKENQELSLCPVLD